MKLAVNDCVVLMYYNTNTKYMHAYATERAVMPHRTGQASGQ